MCEERLRLVQEFHEAAEAFSSVVPGLKASDSLNAKGADLIVAEACQRMDLACAALERHDKEHRCA